ncbi:peroxisomal targeting signal 1 receptor [Drosophila sulfurigaster albostrigata]|uniref:peroxisomal targeting signal 1 receptor n=1 Tax=Drosophila sulfurigaster albostrigata TaxID=89887 RepID=UPI002D219A42|nr:peroxisomal targeting signal 1 receptor [Drosophila sulfurigaster albostrigata]
MSLRPLVEGDCGAVNPLMQLGGQFTRDVARKDEGFAAAPFERQLRPDEQMVSEYLGHVAAPPQSFQMNSLLQEMRDINIHGAGGAQVDEVMAGQWSRDFQQQQKLQSGGNKMLHMQPQQQQLHHAQEFFDEPLISSQNFRPPPMMMMQSPYMAITAPPATQTQHDTFFDEQLETIDTDKQRVEDWINDYPREKEQSEQTAANFNEKFWQRLQDEWQKLAEENEHPWLSEYNENLDAYKEYEFAEQNPMSELPNAFEKGKEYLAKGDIPSAVLCFEVAAKKEPERLEVWQLLGASQAENEMDPQAIAALKRALDLQPENRQVLMSLAVCYTNEGLQSSAVKMLSNWIEVHPQYKQLLAAYPQLQAEGSSLASSLIGANKLRDLQEVYLQAVRMQPSQVDADLQEALGVLYNLSGEFDKAVDCYRSAVQVDPQNAKLWNRLGASLANGSRSVEAVEAYQHALQLQPGFIRVRYNVGVCCMNLKAYKEGAEHLLTALTMQAHTNASRDLPNAEGIAGGQQQMSESIWSTLKMVISLMGRSELQTHVSERNLAALNAAFKD